MVKQTLQLTKSVKDQPRCSTECHQPHILPDQPHDCHRNMTRSDLNDGFNGKDADYLSSECCDLAIGVRQLHT